MKHHEERLSHDELKRMLNYSPETGVFTWTEDASKPHRHHLRKGVAGTVNKKGYRSIMVNLQKYKAHRLAWFFMTGKWPSGQIDHRNTIKDDNRFENLREATNEQNCRNRIYRQSKTPYRGVGLYSKSGKWYAAIHYEKKRRHLGYFDTPEEASAVYEAEARRIYGEFYHPPNIPAP